MANEFSTLRNAAREALYADVRNTSEALKAIPGVGSGANGLTPDAVKFSPEYRAAKKAYDTAFRALQNFNRTK